MKYYFSAISAFVIWGTFAFVLKPLHAFSSFDILIHRVVFASICMILFSFLFRKNETFLSIRLIQSLDKKTRSQFFKNILLSAIMLTFNWFCFIYVMNAVSINATSLAYLICPILTTFLASIFLKEKLNKGQWFAVFLSFLSCIILGYGNFKDLFYSLLIALTYAIYLVMQKNNFNVDRFFTLTLHIVLSTFFLLPILLFLDNSTPKNSSFYGFVLIMAVFYTILPLFLNIYALKKLDSSLVGTLLYLNPMISFLVAIVFYKEPINSIQILGFSLIFLSVVVFNLAFFYSPKSKKVFAENFK